MFLFIIDVFVVVHAEKVNGETMYRVAVSSKPGVPPFGPYLPENALFPKNEEFRTFLLTKCKK